MLCNICFPVLHSNIYCKKEQAICIICVFRLIHGIFMHLDGEIRDVFGTNMERTVLKGCFVFFPVLCGNCLAVASINVYCKFFAIVRSIEEHMNAQKSTTCSFISCKSAFIKTNDIYFFVSLLVHL